MLESGVLSTVPLVLTVFVLLYYWSTKKPKGYPPGPKWLPVFGSALEVERCRKKTGYFSSACAALEKQYKSSMVGLKVGRDLVVVINDYESMKAMVTNEDCDGRPLGLMYEDRTFGKRQGLLVVDGPLWVEQRRFTQRHLRDFGFGKTDMSNQIEFEAGELVKYYNQLIDKQANPEVDIDKLNNNQKNGKIHCGNDCLADEPKRMSEIADARKASEASGTQGIAVEMEGFFGVPVINALWWMMARKRYDFDDEEVNYLQAIMTELLKELDMIGCLFNHFPILKHVAPDLCGYTNFLQTHQAVWDFVGKELENHKRTFNPAAPRDLMDVYIQALQSEDPGDYFSEQQLISICEDLFIAGSETSAKAIGFGFLFLTLNQDVQKKAQQEIDLIVGRERLPSFDDRPRMPYVNAIVLESLRMFMGRTMDVPHRAIRNTTLMGYKIPKDTMIVVNMSRILMDEFWGDPEAFRPERFIDENGKLTVPERFVPFGFGRHRCLGEVLARSNMFMLTAALLQSFTFSPAPGEKPPTTEYNDGVTAGPKPYKALITRRPI